MVSKPYLVLKRLYKIMFLEDFMKTKTIAFSLLAGFALVLLAGCDASGSRTQTPSEDSIVIEVGSGQTKYYSLDPVREVTGSAAIASTGWDIAVQPGRIIQTNSGSTASALSSGGQGGVWHTEKTDITATALGDRVITGDFASWSTDTLKFVAGQMGAPNLQTVNVMNHFAWSTGDGDSAQTVFTGAQYNGKGFISATPGKMPPDFSVTNRVYIIKRGSSNGGYHRIQITGYSSVSGTDTYTLKHLKL
jgi:hypothetical protein